MENDKKLTQVDTCETETKRSDEEYEFLVFLAKYICALYKLYSYWKSEE